MSPAVKGKGRRNHLSVYTWPSHTILSKFLTQENLSLVFANNKDTDQPAHWRSLISTSVIRLLESIISELATNKISIF